MVSTLMVFQAVIAVILILLVLVQFGKGAEAGLLSAGDSVMSGSQRGNILSKFTVVISVLFFANSIYLAKIQGEKSEKSLLDTEAPVATPFNSDEAKAPEASNPEAAPAAEKPAAAKPEETKAAPAKKAE